VEVCTAVTPVRRGQEHTLHQTGDCRLSGSPKSLYLMWEKPFKIKITVKGK